MRRFFTLLLFLLIAVATAGAQAQEFSRLNSRSIQPKLSEPLQWARAPATAAPDLPEAFQAKPDLWVFSPYTAQTTLPTATGDDVWVRFTLAPSTSPQSWVIRIPRLTIQRVSLYELSADGFLPAQTAGASIAHSAWIRGTRTPSFEVMTSNLPKTYFLRFEHHTPIAERPELLSQVDFADGGARDGTLLGAMLGVFGLLLLASVVAFSVARNAIFVSLAVFVTTLSLHFLVMLGYAGWLLWPNSVQLTLAMNWTAPLFAMAAGSWFLVHVSHAKDISKPVYGMLCLVALISLGVGLIRLYYVDPSHRNYFNGWAALVVGTNVLSLIWLSWRGVRANFWLFGGMVPIAAVGAAQLAYSYGWAAGFDSAQAIYVVSTLCGLAWLFALTVWRSRVALVSSELAAALNAADPETGLTHARIAHIRLPQLLLRADQLKLGCGVLTLRWLNFIPLAGPHSAEKQKALLKYVGQVLRRLVRDIDTAARIDEDHFMILVEGPISKPSLSSLATQILTAFIRAEDRFGSPSPFDFHVAIWHATDSSGSADAVTDALKTRLEHMSLGTKRPVQFVDAIVSHLTTDSDLERVQRRDDVLAKIDAIEASPSVRAVLNPNTPRKH